MVVRAETPFRTLQDFVAFAKANPGKLNFAYGNMGSLAGGAMYGGYAGRRSLRLSLWQGARRERKRDPLAITQDGLAHRQLKSAVTTH